MATAKNTYRRTQAFPANASEVGLPLEIDSGIRVQVSESAQKLQAFREESATQPKLQQALQSLQALLIDQAYRGEVYEVGNPAELLQIRGPNESQLSYEVFRPFTAQKCETHEFQRRAALKVKRTLRNLAEMRKAYEDEYSLGQLEEQLLNLDLDVTAGVLRQKLVSLTRLTPFKTYQHLKRDFLETWVKQVSQNQGAREIAPFADHELSESMKALQQQKNLLGANPQVLRYKDQQFFRLFNTVPHPDLQSRGLHFWKTDENVEAFHQFINSLRESFGREVPFYVFRFENSFTYLLCGFADESLLESLLDDQETVPVYAKIVMRQTNQVYRELQAPHRGNQTLYHQCLKEALRPFVEQLNARLQMNLPASFLRFLQG